jgi:16S rRNA processing protein RimM
MDRETLAIGRLGAPKGLRGDLKVQSYSGESAHFFRLKEARLHGQGPRGEVRELTLKVIRIEGEGPSLTMAFEGYPTPESARVLTGLEIIVPREEAAPLKPGEWYIHDLIGLRLIDASGGRGTELAVVRSVVEGGSDPWLEAILPNGRSALVTFRKEFVGEIDLEAGTIELLAPWLLDE